MITSAEAQIGTKIAVVASIGTVVSVLVFALLIGPDAEGYDPTYGPLTNIVNFIQSFSFVFVIVLSMNLFGADDKPYFRIISSIIFIGAVIQLFNDLAPTANANSVWPEIYDATQIEAIAGVGQFGYFPIWPVWVLTLIRADQGVLLPSWGAMAGRGAGYLILVLQAGSLFGLLPLNIIFPLFMLGGIILFPTFVLGVSRAFGKKIEIEDATA